MHQPSNSSKDSAVRLSCNATLVLTTTELRLLLTKSPTSNQASPILCPAQLRSALALMPELTQPGSTDRLLSLMPTMVNHLHSIAVHTIVLATRNLQRTSISTLVMFPADQLMLLPDLITQSSLTPLFPGPTPLTLADGLSLAAPSLFKRMRIELLTVLDKTTSATTMPLSIVLRLLPSLTML